MTAPILLLTCRVCGWRPSQDQELAVVKTHYETDHSGAPPAMNLVAYCPVDDTPLNVRATHVIRQSGQNLTIYDCEKCMRTYKVKWSPQNL